MVYVLWVIERGCAPSRGPRGYDGGSSKDSLWNGYERSRVPDGLRRRAGDGQGGGAGDRRSGRSRGGGAGGDDEAVEEAVQSKAVENERAIKFKDALGRRFNFPFEMAQKWEAMGVLINQEFAHAEPIRGIVERKEYDLIGPLGEIILPRTWETVLEPEWMVKMHMWPIPEPPRDEKAVMSPPDMFPNTAKRRAGKPPSHGDWRRMSKRDRSRPLPLPSYPGSAPRGPGWTGPLPGGNDCTDLSDANFKELNLEDDSSIRSSTALCFRCALLLFLDTLEKLWQFLCGHYVKDVPMEAKRH